MAMKIDQQTYSTSARCQKIERLFELSAQKISDHRKDMGRREGTPVFTVNGKYTSRGWTEWTQGFQFGSAILQFDATGEKRFSSWGARARSNAWRRTSRTWACMITASTTFPPTGTAGADARRKSRAQ